MAACKAVGAANNELEVYETGRELLEAANASGLFVYAELDVKYDRPETRIIIDRDKAANLGIDWSNWGSISGPCWAVILSTDSILTAAVTKSFARSYSLLSLVVPAFHVLLARVHRPREAVTQPVNLQALA